jgi:ketopantoate reductase
MKITVIGPGAVGTLLGALLQDAGHEVVLRGRGPGRKPRRRIRVILPEGWVTVDVAAGPGPDAASSELDAVLVTLARHHLHAARRPDFARMAGSGTGPVAFVNTGGPDADRLGVPPERQRLCLTLLTAVSLQEGDVELAPGRAVLVHERSDALSECFSPLGRFGIQVTAVDDARPLANSLLLLQLLSLPSAMCNATLDGFLSAAEGRQIAQSVLGEGFEALSKAGMPIAPLPVMDPRELMGRISRRGGSFADSALGPDRAYTTVLQSFLKGRPPEVSHINRRIVEIGSSAGLHLTWNWRLLQKVSRVTGLGFFRDPAELLRSLE